MINGLDNSTSATVQDSGSETKTTSPETRWPWWDDDHGHNAHGWRYHNDSYSCYRQQDSSRSHNDDINYHGYHARWRHNNNDSWTLKHEDRQSGGSWDGNSWGGYRKNSIMHWWTNTWAPQDESDQQPCHMFEVGHVSEVEILQVRLTV